MAEHALIPGKTGWVPYLPPSRSGQWPWSDTKSWCWGLVALFIVAGTTVAWAVPYVQSKLERQTRVRLVNAGIDAPTLNFRWNYRDLTVTGELPPNVTADQFATAVRKDELPQSALFANGIRQLRLNLSQPDPALTELINKDQLLKVTVEASEFEATLTGVVETEAQRHQLISAVLVSGVEQVNDNLEVTMLNTANHGSDAKITALAEMLELTGPDNVAFAGISLDKDDLNYRILANSKESAKSIEDAASVTLVEFRVTGEMDFIKNGEIDVIASSDGNKLTIKGQVLTEEQQRRLSFAANEALGAEKVVNEISISDQSARIAGADERVNSLTSILSQFSPDVIGEVGLKGMSLSLTAMVENSTTQSALLEITAAARAGGLNVAETIRLREEEAVDEAVVLQAELDRLAEEIQENVVFTSGTVDLSDVAQVTLDKVVERLNRFPQLRVEVQGHTDNVGRDTVNDKISYRRADAVKTYLASHSVLDTRLVAVGYGERRPLVSNDSAQGRQRNRRVRFNVITQSTEK